MIIINNFQKGGMVMYQGGSHNVGSKLSEYLSVPKYEKFDEFKEEVNKYFKDNQYTQWSQGNYFPPATEADIYRIILKLIDTVEKQQREIIELKLVTSHIHLTK